MHKFSLLFGRKSLEESNLSGTQEERIRAREAVVFPLLPTTAFFCKVYSRGQNKFTETCSNGRARSPAEFIPRILIGNKEYLTKFINLLVGNINSARTCHIKLHSRVMIIESNFYLSFQGYYVR